MYLGRNNYTYYMTEADTLIGDLTYAQAFDHNGDYTAGVRDEVGKVMVVPEGQESEYLMYDFTIPVGVDTTLEVYLLYWMSLTEVSMHGAGPIGTDGRLVVQGEGFEWIEGIGCTAGLFMEPMVNVSGSSPGLACVSVEGMIIYPIQQPGVCEITTEVSERPIAKPSLYPNPTTDILVIEQLPRGIPFQYAILSADGRVLQWGSTCGDRMRITTAALPAGCYAIQVVGSGQQFYATFVKVQE